MSDGLFFITSGVRRALASLEAGRATIPATIHREGERPEYRPRMSLHLLYSPKTSIKRDARFLRIVPPIDEPIEIEPLDARWQPRSVPLERVRIIG